MGNEKGIKEQYYDTIVAKYKKNPKRWNYYKSYIEKDFIELFSDLESRFRYDFKENDLSMTDQTIINKHPDWSEFSVVIIEKLLKEQFIIQIDNLYSLNI